MTWKTILTVKSKENIPTMTRVVSRWGRPTPSFREGGGDGKRRQGRGTNWKGAGKFRARVHGPPPSTPCALTPVTLDTRQPFCSGLKLLAVSGDPGANASDHVAALVVTLLTIATRIYVGVNLSALKTSTSAVVHIHLYVIAH